MLQTDFPVEAEPFKTVAARIGVSESEVLERVRKMKKDGIIRRIGAVFDSKKLGYASTLCAARVPESRKRDFVETVNACPGVTHNYQRSNDYNIWFTLTAPSEEELERTIKEIRRLTGVDDILSMPAVRTFKINASFEV